MSVFLAGNTVIILSLGQLKMRILRFGFKNTTSNLESQHSTVKFTKQVPPGGGKQRAASEATASASAAGPPPPKQQALDYGAKQVRGGELKKLVGQYVVEEMLH